jgi:predicted Zn-ribbon and HTH transcriptional regulator
MMVPSLTLMPAGTSNVPNRSDTSTGYSNAEPDCRPRRRRWSVAGSARAGPGVGRTEFKGTSSIQTWHTSFVPTTETMAYRRDLLAMLTAGPRTASSLARELGLRRGDMEAELRHIIRSIEASGHVVVVDPARCKACGFVFDERKLTKPSKCPACKASRLFEPLLRIETL